MKLIIKQQIKIIFINNLILFNININNNIN